MDLDPGQPVFVKEVSGNVWRTATVDQPAAEPDSYWVRFPDNSILRRTRSMIKPRSQPSHFELQAEAQPGNFEGKINSHSFDSFVRYRVPKFPHSSATFNIISGFRILTSPKVLQGALGDSACPAQCSQPYPMPANRHLTGLTWFPIVLYYIK